VAFGKQPMISSDGRFVIVYNGEIYNHLKLKAELAREGVVFTTTSDTEVILKLYQYHGVDYTLNKIEGMFAFAIWDKVEKTLFVARDRIGEKPFYYAHASQAFVFGSEIKLILKSGLVSGEPNRDAFYEYFCRSKVAGSRTMFKNVHELKPGHFVLADGRVTSVRQRQYWDLAEQYTQVQRYQISDKFEAQERVEQHLLDSINSRMISHVPVGLLTSGGIDPITRILNVSVQGTTMAILTSRLLRSR